MKRSGRKFGSTMGLMALLIVGSFSAEIEAKPRSGHQAWYQSQDGTLVSRREHKVGSVTTLQTPSMESKKVDEEPEIEEPVVMKPEPMELEMTDELDMDSDNDSFDDDDMDELPED